MISPYYIISSLEKKNVSCKNTGNDRQKENVLIFKQILPPTCSTIRNNYVTAQLFGEYQVGIRAGTILYPESSGSLASSLLPGETLEYWNSITTGFLW